VKNSDYFYLCEDIAGLEEDLKEIKSHVDRDIHELGFYLSSIAWEIMFLLVKRILTSA
jgi:hypothetical protein